MLNKRIKVFGDNCSRVSVNRYWKELLQEEIKYIKCIYTLTCDCCLVGKSDGRVQNSVTKERIL